MAGRARKSAIKAMASVNIAGKSKAEILAKEVIKADEKGETVTKGELLRRSGYASTTIAKQTAKPFTTQAFQNALRVHGVNDETISGVFKDALHAKQGAWFKGKYKEADVADHKIRMESAKNLAELSGLKKIVIETHNVNVNIEGEDLRSMLGF